MKLRVIPTKAHGAIDMATGPTLMAAPTLFRMNGNTGATLPPRLVGAAATAYALLTDYEFGLKRVLPMRAHLALDVVGGVTLAATPWLTGAARNGVRHWLPHAIVGGQSLVLAFTTKDRPPRAPRARTLLGAMSGKGALAVGGAIGLGAAAFAARKATSE